MFCPRDLRVVMRVQIDEAGRNDKTPRINLFGTPFRNLAEFYNAIASNGDISDDRRTPRSVDNGAAANHDARILTHGQFLLVDGTLMSVSLACSLCVITLVMGGTLCKAGAGNSQPSRNPGVTPAQLLVHCASVVICPVFRECS